jgi:hypothetical protein
LNSVAGFHASQSLHAAAEARRIRVPIQEEIVAGVGDGKVEFIKLNFFKVETNIYMPNLITGILNRHLEALK